MFVVNNNRHDCDQSELIAVPGPWYSSELPG
jgi:hypothetical protein